MLHTLLELSHFNLKVALGNRHLHLTQRQLTIKSYDWSYDTKIPVQFHKWSVHKYQSSLLQSSHFFPQCCISEMICCSHSYRHLELIWEKWSYISVNSDDICIVFKSYKQQISLCACLSK